MHVDKGIPYADFTVENNETWINCVIYDVLITHGRIKKMMEKHMAVTLMIYENMLTDLGQILI